jgi:hypothetical protein
VSTSLAPVPRLAARAGLGVLALSQGVVGAWALLAPESFFRSFPAAGHAWVWALPPYNEHLTRDVGALGVALTLVLATVAVRADAWSCRVAALAFGAYAAPHTVFHVTHLHGLTAADAVAQTAGFVLQLVLVVVVLVGTGRRTRTQKTATRGPMPAEDPR